MADLAVYFLDVGQGDGTLIVFPDKTTAIVDLGSKKNGQIAGQDAVGTIVNILGQLKKNKIDHLFITHGDGDHYNLLPNLLALGTAPAIGKVYIGGPVSDYNKWMKDNVLAPANNRGELTVYGDCAHDAVGKPSWSFGGANMYLLSVNYPNRSSSAKNAKSIVLLVEYKTRKLILTGDAEGPTEQFIVTNAFKNNHKFLECFMVKMGHHGAEAGTTSGWLSVLKPQAAIASGDQKWGHPYCTVVDRILKDGAIRTKPKFEHGYVCGGYNSFTKDYVWNNHVNSYYIFSNIYIIDKVYDPSGSGLWTWGAAGANWLWNVDSSGNMQIVTTDALAGKPTGTGSFK